MSHSEGVDYCSDDCQNYWRRDADRLRAVHEKRGEDLDALLTRCMQAEAMLDIAVRRGNEYHAAIARVREMCEKDHDHPHAFLAPYRYALLDVLRALDGGSE